MKIIQLYFKKHMLNDYFIIQLILISIVFFIYFVNELFNLLILSIFYLIILSMMTLLNDSDILISFLIIIDLGVFFVLFSFLLHLTKFLTYKNINDTSFKTLFSFSLFLSYIFLFNYTTNFYTIWNYNKIIEYTWFFFINYLDFYTIFNTNLKSDMHLLKEIYFHINSIEFILISIFLIIGILSLYFLLNLITLFNNKLNINNIQNIKKFNINTSVSFFKYQNFNKQINTSANSRVWTKLKNDFKTNNNNSNR